MAFLLINGEKKQFDALPENIAELLKHLDIDAATVVAELDGQIVQRQDFAKTKLIDNQKIELLRFVGGG